MAHDPGQPLLCYFTKVPSGYRHRRFSCRRDKEIHACAVYNMIINVQFALLCSIAMNWLTPWHICLNWCMPVNISVAQELLLKPYTENEEPPEVQCCCYVCHFKCFDNTGKICEIIRQSFCVSVMHGYKFDTLFHIKYVNSVYFCKCIVSRIFKNRENLSNREI